MGDRSQIAIKQPTKADKSAKIYLYAHWAGTAALKKLRDVIKAGERLDDAEYLSRIIFREIGAGEDGETGFGIGNEIHTDIEHLVPVLDCEHQLVTFEIPEWAHNKRPSPGQLTFAQFASLSDEVIDSW